MEVYDTEANKWETLQNMQVQRGRFAIAVVDGNVYAIGGNYIPHKNGSTNRYIICNTYTFQPLLGCDGQKELNSAELYDSLTLKWKLIESAPVVRSHTGEFA